MPNSIEYFVQLFDAARAKYLNIQEVTPTKPFSKRWEDLAIAASICDENRWDYAEYIDYVVQRFARAGYFPKANHMKSPKLEKAFGIHLNRIGRRQTDVYVSDDETFTVVATGISYPTTEVLHPLAQDPSANFIMEISRKTINWSEFSDQEIRVISNQLEYTIAKLCFMGRMPTEGLVKMKMEIRDVKDKSLKE